ncbi:MAG: zinc-binding dehydrogenase, partial [Minwuiales bacterium]|nr:zinc-binding dehydrogenase [Minwuiales bacterium]
RGECQLCNDWALIGVQSDGGFAQKVVVPAKALIELPDHLGWEQAAFVEPFANAVNAWERSGAGSDTRVAIVGAGGLGLGLVACAAESGCVAVAVSDLSSSRLRAAAELGAGAAETHLAGTYDVVFDTVGSAAARQTAVALTRKGGTCVLLGFASPVLEVDAGELIRSQKRIVGSFVYSKQQFVRAIGLAARCSAEWVTNLSFSEVEPLLAGYLDGDFSVVKAVLRPNR